MLLASPLGGTYGVFIDYCSMPQVPRDDKQEQLFRLALPGMSTLYSHPHTCVTPLFFSPAPAN